MPFIPAPKELRDTTLADIQLVCWTTDPVDGADPGAGVDPGVGTAPAEERRRRLALPISLAARALLLVAGLVWTLTGPARHGRGPVDSGITAPLETPATTPVSAPPSTPRRAAAVQCARDAGARGFDQNRCAAGGTEPAAAASAGLAGRRTGTDTATGTAGSPGQQARIGDASADVGCAAVVQAPLPPTGDAGSGGRR